MKDREQNLAAQLELATQLVLVGDRCEDCTAQICGQCEGTDSDALELAKLVIELSEAQKLPV
jgi:hypothetical protein